MTQHMKYRVYVRMQSEGCYTVEADSEEAAEKFVATALEENDAEGLDFEFTDTGSSETFGLVERA